MLANVIRTENLEAIHVLIISDPYLPPFIESTMTSFRSQPEGAGIAGVEGLEEELQFAPFSIVPARRSLMRDGSVVSIGSRATDILLYLIAHPGELKTNQEIIKYVWPDTFVDEANLRVHVSALRKVLGDTKAEPHFIANIPGRGYTFIARVERRLAALPAEQFQASPDFRDVDLVRIVGRDQTIEAILSQLEKGRLITVTGPGGIGKSTVAKVIGSRLSDKIRIVRADLSEVASGELLPTIIASAIGVPSRSDSLIDATCKALETVPSLVILDGCEHLIDDATRFVEIVLQRTKSVRFPCHKPRTAPRQWRTCSPSPAAGASGWRDRP